MLRRLLVVVLVFLVWTPAAFAWSWPVEGPVLQPFAYDGSHPYAAGQHRGIDIGAGSAGEPVAAPAAGTVAFAGSVPTSGKCVTIETEDGYSVTLTHLGSIGVAKGATVAEGDVVGTVGPSGTPEVDRPYVHLGIRQTADPLGYVDPLGFLPALSSPSPPAPTHNPGSVGSSAPGAAAPPHAPSASPAPSTSPGPAASPAPAVSPEPAATTVPTPDEPAAPADPAPATSSPEPAQADPTAATGDSKPVAGRGKPVPAPSASTGSNDFADLPSAADGTTDGAAASGDGTGAGSGARASDPVGRPVDAVAEAAPRHDHSRGGRASGASTTLPVESGEPWAGAGRHPQRLPVSVLDPSARRPQPAAWGSILSLVLGLGPGLVALAAALAAALRRRVVESAVGAVVVHLPRHRVERRRSRLAA